MSQEAIIIMQIRDDWEATQWPQSERENYICVECRSDYDWFDFITGLVERMADRQDCLSDYKVLQHDRGTVQVVEFHEGDKQCFAWPVRQSRPLVVTAEAIKVHHDLDLVKS